MAGINIPSSALIGAFSSSRKEARNREQEMIEKMYSMHQKKQQQQYLFDAKLNEIAQNSGKQANAIVFGQKNAQILSTEINDKVAEMKREIRERYNGNVTKYMLEEGNDKLNEAMTSFDTKISDMKRNSSEITKYMKSAQDPNQAVNVIDQSQELQDFNDGKITSFKYKGLLTPIDDKWIGNVLQGSKATGLDIINHENNDDILRSNYQREYGAVPTEADLIQYAQDKYIGAKDPTTIGTQKPETSVGSIMVDTYSEDKKIGKNIKTDDIIKNYDNVDAYLKNEFRGTNSIHEITGQDSTKKSPTKDGVYVLSPGGTVFTEYDDVIKEVNNNFVDEDATNLYGTNGVKIGNEDFSTLAGIELGEFFGGQPRRMKDQLIYEGTRRAFKYTIDGKDSILVLSGDKEKDLDNLNRINSSGADLTVVNVAQLRDKDRLKDDPYYKEINLSSVGAARLTNTQASEKTDSDIVLQEIHKTKKAKANSIKNEKALASSRLNLVKSLGLQAGSESEIDNYLISSTNTLNPVLQSASIDPKLNLPLLSYALAVSNNFQQAEAIINNLDSKINNPVTQNDKMFAKAIKAGRLPFLKYLESFMTIAEKDDFYDIHKNYNKFVTAQQAL